MPFTTMRRIFRRFLDRLTALFVQELPSELHACEVCRKPACSREEWLHCRKRIAAARHIETGDLAALEELRRLHREEEASKADPPDAR